MSLSANRTLSVISSPATRSVCRGLERLTRAARLLWCTVNKTSNVLLCWPRWEAGNGQIRPVSSRNLIWCTSRTVRAPLDADTRCHGHPGQVELLLLLLDTDADATADDVFIICLATCMVAMSPPTTNTLRFLWYTHRHKLSTYIMCRLAKKVSVFLSA